MHRLYLVVFMIWLLGFTPRSDFKSRQLQNQRVKTAYAEKWAAVRSYLQTHHIDTSDFSIYLRAFKEEKELEVWAREDDAKKYTKIHSYSICRTSGQLGPKRQQGDHQIPEGYYHINKFNPWSNYYLSLGINYPNKSDRILGVRGDLGGDIFIHGACVTIGCIPITDERIKELYILCVEAKNNGQSNIPVTIFPTRLNETHWQKLQRKAANQSEKLKLWLDLKQGFDYFNRHFTLPEITFLSNGRHKVK